MESNLDESDVTIPLVTSTAKAVETEVDEDDSDGDGLNSSIEALDWSDIDAELAESGSEAFGSVIENLRKSMSSLHNESRADGEGNTQPGPSSGFGFPTGALSMNRYPPAPPDMKLVAVMRIRSGTSSSTDDAPVELEPGNGIREEAIVPTEAQLEDERTESEYGSGDQTSNAPVLDDGPIWSKGSKKYRFVENRRINQILTFGVILSVVLATGIGLGNLAAVNECEEELKVASRPSACSCSGRNPFQDHQPIVRTASFATNHDIFESSSSSHFPKPKQFNVDTSGNEEILPFMPPPQRDFPTAEERAKWSDKEWSQFRTTVGELPLPAQELSRIIKLLDDLTEKLEKYENKTGAAAASRNAEKLLKRARRHELSRGEPEPNVIISEQMPTYKEILKNTGIFPMNGETVIDDSLENDDGISFNMDATAPSGPAPAPEPVKEIRNPNPTSSDDEQISKKRNKFRRNKNAEDKLHKKREHRQTPKGEYDSDSYKDAFQNTLQRQKNNRDAFQDRDNADKPNSVKQNNRKHGKHEASIGTKIDKSHKYCNKEGNDCKQKKIKVKKVKRDNKKQDFYLNPEWETVRAKARKEARKLEYEQKQQAVKNWYFDRAKGREKSRH